MSKRKASTGGSREAKMKRQMSASDDDSDNDLNLTQQADCDVASSEANIGIVEKISLRNFMCHNRLDIPLGPHVNFIMGRNGSGKSAIVTALVVGLGGKATVTNRGSTVKGFIKSGKQKAEIEIKLRNRGPDAYKPEEFGNSIIVERAFKKDGSGSYKLKSKDGRLVSQKREDLNHILDQFNIQVDNPVAVLNQDTSKSFLNSKSPQDKYKFFLKATQLEQMKQHYNMADSERAVTTDIIERKEMQLPKLEKEVLTWEQKYKSLTALDKLKNSIKTLKETMAWAFVIEKEKGLPPMQKECQQEESRLPKFIQKVEEAKLKVEETVNKQKEIQETLKAMSDNVQQLKPVFDQAKTKLTEIKKDARNGQNEVRKLDNSIRNVTKERSQMMEKIKELQNSAQHDYQAERQEKQAKIDRLEEQVQSLTAQKVTTEHQLDQHRNAVNKYKSDEYKINTECQNLDQRKRKVEKNLSTLSEARKDRIKRFGAYMPTIRQHIEEHFRRGDFNKKPLGPIGSCFALRDAQWALSVERCLGNLMQSFCCHNHQDEVVMQRIFDTCCPENHSRPSTIVSAFKDQKYDISRYKVTHSDFPAVVDVLDIEDPVIFNCLVDQRNIETILLIHDNRVAREFMDPDKNPRPPREAFTREGDQVYSHPSLRYYSTKDTRARFLTANVEEDIAKYQEELQMLCAELDNARMQKLKLTTEIRKNKVEADRNETQLMKIGTNINKLSMDINEIKSIEDPVPVDVTIYEEEVENLEEQLKNLEQQKANKDALYQKLRSKLEEADANFKQVDQQMRAKADGAGPLEDELGHTQNEIEQAKSHKKHYEAKLKEQEKKINDMKKNIEKYQKEINEDVEKASKICPERINTRRSVKNLESEIHQIQNRIKVEEKSRGDPNEITKMYYEKKEAYKQIRNYVQQCREFVVQLEKMMTQRKQQYLQFRRFIAMRAKYFFIVLLSNRQYRGKMTFSHGKETLDISVQPNTSNSGEGAKDMKALSGGERSFATVCFILALWDAMESPFRCLDEFDVFMDMVNRRISMDLMLKVAEQQKHRQFIFLTPQNMNELGIHVKNLNIFRMPDPDRSQSALPFESVNRQQEEEEDA